MVDDETGQETLLRGKAPPGAITEPAVPGEPADPDAPTAAGLTMNETMVPAGSLAATVSLPAAGYQLGDVIGQGGMGEVLVAHDQRIGREVAVKRMRAITPDHQQTQRFLREARIQARLDHPSIVPVHELGADATGRPYFTMKKLSGRTLAQRMADGASLNRMLRAFVEVCHAVDFAHARGVVHRDLKPSNIMLGDFGEVYVIDWGIARVITDNDRAEPDSVEVLPSVASTTQTGTLLGTPGYMAPEQIRGEVAAPTADVYALGSILFEVLAREPLHPRGHGAVGSTLGSPQQSPMLRKPERNIAPELDAICQAALHEDPRRRPTAHELGEQVQQFLDGDRDIERRRKMAAQQVDKAREILETDDPQARSTAMRRAGRALALDPESRDAAELVGALLLEPPDPLPDDLQTKLEEYDRQHSRDRSRKAIYAYLSVLALTPIAMFMDVANWTMFLSLMGAVVLGMGIAWRGSITGHSAVAAIAVVNLAIVVLFTRIAGPFVLTPLAICFALSAFTSIPWFNARTWALVGWTLLAVMLPITLEWIDVLPRTWTIRDDAMVITGDMFATIGRRDEIMLVFTSLVFTLTVALVGLSISRKRRLSQRALFVQAWHLEQLLPSSRRQWVTKTPGRAPTIPS